MTVHSSTESAPPKIPGFHAGALREALARTHFLRANETLTLKSARS